MKMPAGRRHRSCDAESIGVTALHSYIIKREIVNAAIPVQALATQGFCDQLLSTKIIWKIP